MQIALEVRAKFHKNPNSLKMDDLKIKFKSSSEKKKEKKKDPYRDRIAIATKKGQLGRIAKDINKVNRKDLPPGVENPRKEVKAQVTYISQSEADRRAKALIERRERFIKRINDNAEQWSGGN